MTKNRIIFTLCVLILLPQVGCLSGVKRDGGMSPGSGGGGGSGSGGGGGARGESGGRRSGRTGGSHALGESGGSGARRPPKSMLRSFNEPGSGGAQGTVFGPDGQPIAGGVNPNGHAGGVPGRQPAGRPYGPLMPNSLRTPEAELNRGPGVVVGKVNPNPPQVNRAQAVTPQTWNTLVAEHNKLHQKPQLPPTVARGTIADAKDEPSQLAKEAVKRCIECHDSKSGRHLQMDPDPAKALAGLRDLVKQPSGVSWMKVTEMIRSTRFANLPPDQEKAFLAYVSGQAESKSTDELYTQINRKLLQGVTTPVEKLPGHDNPLYRQLLAQIETENPVLNAILSDPALSIYDEGLRKVYQDGGSRDVVGAHHQDSTILQSWKRADGSPLFPDGALYGPLGSGFGTNKDTPSFKFIWRPRENGRIVKDRFRVDPYRDSASTGPAGELMDTQLPVGTIVGEVVYEDGIVKDIRLREVAPGLRTQATAYRLFTESAEMEKSVSDLMAKRPEWNESLSPLRNHLKSKSTLTPGTPLRDTYYSPVIDVQGYQDRLPPIPKEQQMALFQGKKFSSALDKEWKREGDKVSYAPTADGPSALAARGILHHGVLVNSDSCMRCHEMTSTNFAFLDPNVTNTTTKGSNVNNYGMTYGLIRNNIFSYHSLPFDDPNSFGRGGQFSGVFNTSQGPESLSDNRKNPDGTWKIRGGAPLLEAVSPELEKYYK